MAKSNDKKAYQAAETINHDGDLYHAGDTIMLADDHAAPLLAIKHISLIDDAKAAAAAKKAAEAQAAADKKAADEQAAAEKAAADKKTAEKAAE